MAARPALTASVVAVVAVLSAGITTRALVPSLQNGDDRSYVDALQAGLDGNPATVLLDGTTPAGVMDSRWGDLSRVSTIAGLLPQQPIFGVPSEVLRMVDAYGHLRVVELDDPVAGVPTTEGCAHSITPDSSVIRLESASRPGRQVISFGYLAGADTYADLQVGDERMRVPLKKGLRSVQVPVDGGFEEFAMSIDPGRGDVSACVSQVLVGSPVEGPYGGTQ